MAVEQAIKWLVTPEELDRIPAEKRALGYIRVSDVGGRGDDLISPEVQDHSIMGLAKRESLTVVALIYDIDKSGRNFTKRRVADTVQGVRDGNWKIVILWKWSRWGRNMKESLIYLSAVEDEARGVVRAATEDFDPKTSVGRFSRNQMLLIAELQSDMIADSWKDAHAKRRREGLPHTGGPRFGYAYSKQTGYTVDSKHAPILKNAYVRYVAGESHRGLAAEWRALGLVSTKGNPWHPTGIARMMDTGFAAGLIRERSVPVSADASGGASGRSIWCFDIWRDGAHEAIIDRELWDAYRARRDAQALRAPRLRTAAHALSGLLVCGYEGCGRNMVSVYSGKYKKHSWTCPRARDLKEHKFNTVSNTRAEDAVLEWLLKEASEDDEVDERAERIEAGRKAHGEAEALEAQIKVVTRRLAKLSDAFFDDEIISKDEFVARKAKFDSEISALQHAHRTALARAKASGVSLVRRFKTLAEEWHRFTPPGKREALSFLVARIEVRPGPFGPEKVMPIPAWNE